MIYIFIATLIMPLCGIIARIYYPDNQDFWVVTILSTSTYIAGIFGHKGISEFKFKKCDMLSYEWAKEQEIYTVFIKNTEGGVDVIWIDWDNNLVYQNGKLFDNGYGDSIDILTLFLDYEVYESLKKLGENIHE